MRGVLCCQSGLCVAILRRQRRGVLAGEKGGNALSRRAIMAAYQRNFRFLPLFLLQSRLFQVEIACDVLVSSFLWALFLIGLFCNHLGTEYVYKIVIINVRVGGEKLCLLQAMIPILADSNQFVIRNFYMIFSTSKTSSRNLQPSCFNFEASIVSTRAHYASHSLDSSSKYSQIWSWVKS